MCSTLRVLNLGDPQWSNEKAFTASSAAENEPKATETAPVFKKASLDTIGTSFYSRRKTRTKPSGFVCPTGIVRNAGAHFKYKTQKTN